MDENLTFEEATDRKLRLLLGHVKALHAICGALLAFTPAANEVIEGLSKKFQENLPPTQPEFIDIQKGINETFKEIIAYDRDVDSIVDKVSSNFRGTA